MAPTLITIAALIGIVLIAALFSLIRRLSSTAELPVTADWIDELSVERYQPMLRLLDAGDIEFLKSQPGFTPKMAAKLRRQRAQIFCGYLRFLEADFGRVCSALKLMMLQSQYDRPDLGTALILRQLQFASGMWQINLRLLLYRWGVCSVDVTTLVKTFDSMRIELRSLVPVATAAGA